MPFCRLNGLRIAGVGMADNAHARVGGQHAFHAARRFGLPSATMTMPACWLKPMPTPPPWWKETQVAPPTALISALSNRPVTDRVAAVAHGFRFAVGGSHRTGIEVISAQ